MITITEDNWNAIYTQIMNGPFEIVFEKDRHIYLITAHEETYELPVELVRHLHTTWQIPVQLQEVLAQHGF
jgi:hypothetical protein